MSILDAPSLPTGQVHPVISVLRRNQANANLVVLGDSTGVPQNFTTDPRWVYLLTQWLATQYPAYTVNYRQWNDTNQSYDALGSGTSVAMQTGTGTGNAGGPFVLNVYNGSVSGAAVEYVFGTSDPTRLNLMIPTAPDAVLLSYAKNSTETAAGAYRKHLWSVGRLVKDAFPSTSLGVVVQCPNGPAAGNAAAVFNRLADARALAKQEAWWIADVAQAFIDYGNYTADLLNGDGIHPNAAGSTLWFNTAKRVFSRSPLVTTADTPITSRFFAVPAKMFDVLSGSPTFAVTNSHPAWAMPNGADSAIIADMVNVPADWTSWNAYLVWFTSATTGTASFTPRYGWLSSIFGNQAGTVGAPSAFGVITQAASGTANNIRFLSVATEKHLSGQPMTLTITRNGSTDSVAAAAQIIGFLFERCA